MSSRKRTAWRKNRRFSEVHGGRRYRKIPDRIPRRHHGLKHPAPWEALPRIREDNPSRDFFFPISGEEVYRFLQRFGIRNISDVWLRRIRKEDYARGRIPQAQYIWGSGVILLVLYPWPKDLKQRWGHARPSKATLRYYAPWGPELGKDQDGWFLKWTRTSLRHYYVTGILLHELGHHFDPKYRSPARTRSGEDFADDFALAEADRLTQTRGRGWVERYLSGRP